MNIGYYKRITNLERDSDIDIQLFLDSIRNGKWEDLAHDIRLIRDKQERKLAKEKLPSVTISGLFRSRLDNSLETHSGLLGIDVDDLKDVEAVKTQLMNDPFIRATFVTISGNGLCLIFLINPTKHREVFYDICRYLYETYTLVADPTSVNESRIRYISYDPDLVENTEAIQFNVKYERQPKEKIPEIIFSERDFIRLIDEINGQKLNICESYHHWVRIGFALAHQFQEEGRAYFHTISRHSQKYRPYLCDRQYDACLKAQGMSISTIATFYFFCKQAGLTIYSKESERINYSFRHGKEAGLSASQIRENLRKFEGVEITDEEAQSFFNTNVTIGGGKGGILEELELFIRQNYNLRRNEVTRYLERDGIPMKQEDYNSIYIAAKKVIHELTYELVDRLLNSVFIARYNPIKNFLEGLEYKGSGFIEDLFKSIKTPNYEYALHFGRKWLVSIIASVYGTHSPLMLVLCGRIQNTGKTEFFRRLLPDELKRFYAESKLDAGKDDEILMTQKLIIMDDEMGGKNKKEDKRLKELISKQIFSLREPYGRHNVELNRLAVLAGTTNDEEILFDTTGNRRILPILVTDIDHELYNHASKKNIFAEAYDLYKGGFNWNLNKDDIAYLSSHTYMFEATSIEGELVSLYYDKSDEEWVTSTDIKIVVEKHSGQRISLDKLCKQLIRLGFIRRERTVDDQRRRCYGAKERKHPTIPGPLF